MTVTEIVELSKDRCKVYLDYELAFVCYKAELRTYRIQVDREFSTQDYQLFLQEVLLKRAKCRAMHLLQSRDYTRQQLERKLAQGYYPQEVIEQTLDAMSDYHYIDDLRYALAYMNCHERDKSRRRMEQDLLRKGISPITLENAWKEWEKQGGVQDEQEMLRRLLEKKKYDPAHTDRKERQKLFGYLQRKGFGWDAIGKALGEYLPDVW